MTATNLQPQQTSLCPVLTSAHQESHGATKAEAPLPSQGSDGQARSHAQLKGHCLYKTVGHSGCRASVASARRRQGVKLPGDLCFTSGAPWAQVTTGEALCWGKPCGVQVTAVPAKNPGSLEPSISEWREVTGLGLGFPLASSPRCHPQLLPFITTTNSTTSFIIV